MTTDVTAVRIGATTGATRKRKRNNTVALRQSSAQVEGLPKGGPFPR